MGGAWCSRGVVGGAWCSRGVVGGGAVLEVLCMGMGKVTG